MPISIHALREEGDRDRHLQAQRHQISIHALREEGDADPRPRWTDHSYFYPRPPRGGRHPHKVLMAYNMGISIHALREEGDVCGWIGDFLFYISIHALREEGDMELSRNQFNKKDFYPRPPRGGRHNRRNNLHRHTDFYPRPPRGGRPLLDGVTNLTITISIHALREEGDLGVPVCTLLEYISIHALREEGDSKNRDKSSIFKQIIQHSARI